MIELSKDLISLIEKHDGDALVSVLHDSRLDIGTSLLDIAKQLLFSEQEELAVYVFSLFIEGVTSEDERRQFAKTFGDISLKLGKIDVAIEFYLSVGPDTEMIELVGETFAEDLDSLVVYLEKCVDIFPKENPALYVHNLLDRLIQNLWQTEGNSNARETTYSANIKLLTEKCHPETVETLRSIQEYLTVPKVLIVGDNLLENVDGKWHVASNLTKEQLLNSDGWELANKEDRYTLFCEDILSLWACVHAHQVDEKIFYTYDRYIIIDFRLLQSALTSFSLQPLFDSNFVFNFLDARNLRNSYLRMFSGASNMPATRHLNVVDGGEEVSNLVESLKTNLIVQLKGEQESIKKLLSDYYSGKKFLFSGACNEGKLQKGKPRILFLTSRFSTYVQHCTRDLAWGFEKNGCETYILKGNYWDGYGLRTVYIQSVVASFKPDIVFAIDHLRYEFASIFPKELPFVTWVQDLLPSLVNTPKDTTLGTNDIVFAFNFATVTELKKNSYYEKRKIYLLPVSVSSYQYYPIPNIKKIHDVVYVSHVYPPELTWFNYLSDGFPENITNHEHRYFLENFLKELNLLNMTELRKLQHNPLIEIPKFVTLICDKYTINYSNSLLGYLDTQGNSGCGSTLANHLIVLMKMKPILHLVKNEINVSVYGNNWGEYSDCAPIAMGPIKNGNDQNLLINETRINLNLNPFVTYHMRAPEVIAAKGFLLSRNILNDSMPITEFYDENSEIALFSDLDDLLEKVQYFLENKKERELIADNGYKKFISKHSIKSTTSQIMSIVAKESNKV